MTEPELLVKDDVENKRKIDLDSDKSSENPLKKPKVEVPEGMSKNQWKKIQKRKAWEDNKAVYREGKKQKKKEQKEKRKAKIQELISKGEDPSVIYQDSNYHQAKRTKPVENQNPTGVSVIMDCSFDHLMNYKEIVSLSNQITRAYSAKRIATEAVDLKISSFNDLLKERFDSAVGHYKNWKNIDFVEDELEKILPLDDSKKMENFIYLTADTENSITSLDPGMTYIVGGIVDKNRHKKLCLNKAEKLGIKVARLPIDEFIKVSGRRVLATSHVYELMVKWCQYKDWGKAFLEVLPPRKLAQEDEGDNANKSGKVHDENESGSESESESEKESEFKSTQINRENEETEKIISSHKRSVSQE